MNQPLLDLGQILVFTLFWGGLFQPIHCREWKPKLIQRWFTLKLYPLTLYSHAI